MQSSNNPISNANCLIRRGCCYSHRHGSGGLGGYFTSANATHAVEGRSFVTTGLADVQRETLLLTIGIERALRDPVLNQDVVNLRRALLGDQLRLQFNQVNNNGEVQGKLNLIVSKLDEYDSMMEVWSDSLDPANAAEVAAFSTVLTDLELQVKSLYDYEEESFFLALGETLRSNQTLQTLLLALSAIVLVSGGVLGLSLRRTVAALREEMRERERAESDLIDANDQIVKSEKLAAIGQLSGGVAHDLRNPLGAIKNSVYMVDKQLTAAGILDDNPKLRRYLDIIDQQIIRSNRIITDLMTFARVGSPTLTETDLAKVLEETLETMVINDNVKLSQEIDSDLYPVMADGEQLQRAFVNLANNAQEAMPNGGQLTITAQIANNHVEISFSDTGEGISEENIGKIFDPLFTTKTKGTGLGLAVCNEIVLQHGGTISAHRNEESSGGTTFKVLLPASGNNGQAQSVTTNDS